jgi:hypothetical protein
MKPRYRNSTLLLAITLLAIAGVLGVARWNQRAAPASHGQLSVPAAKAKDIAVFTALPRASDHAAMVDGRLATKTSQRSPDARMIEAEQPREGEITYRMEDLPKACGTYWVAGASGGFSRVAVCDPASHPGGSH